VLDILVPEIVLKGSGIVAIVGELEPNDCPDLPGHRQIGACYQGGVTTVSPWRHGDSEKMVPCAGSNGTHAALLAQKNFPELLMFTEPELGLRNRGSEGLGEIFRRDHPGSLDCRGRNYIAGHPDADDRDADGNDHSDGELRDAATHVDSPSIG
jgi:hypothetical protein